MGADVGETIRLGLMGLGKWPREAYLPILEEMSGVRVAAVAVRSEATRQFAGEKFGAEVRLHDGWRELAADPKVDAVMVALPNERHGEAIEAAVAAGKHVFYEPPAGLNAAEVGRVFGAIEAAEGIVQPDLELRYLPVVQAVGELLVAGEIGRPMMASVRLRCNWGYGDGPFRYAEDQGFFLWLGCWYLDVLDVVFEAEPVRASVTGGYAMNGRLMDYGFATLGYPDGRIGQFEFNLISGDRTEIVLQVAGTEGQIDAELETGSYRWRKRGEEPREGRAPSSQPAHGFVGMRESIADFVNAIRTGQPPRASLTVARRVHAAALLCAEAEARGGVM